MQHKNDDESLEEEGEGEEAEEEDVILVKVKTLWARELSSVRNIGRSLESKLVQATCHC